MSIVQNRHLSSELSRQMESLAGLSNEQLKGELLKALSGSVEQIVRMAACIRMLEDRGADLSTVRLGMMTYLRKVAYGQVLPDVVVQCQGSPALMNRVASLPIPDQKKIIVGDPIKVVVIDGGEVTHRLVEPLKMPPAIVRQVFANDHIRDDGEQVAWLKAEAMKASRGVAKPQVLIGKREITVSVGGEEVRISRAQLEAYLRSMKEE